MDVYFAEDESQLAYPPEIEKTAKKVEIILDGLTIQEIERVFNLIHQHLIREYVFHQVEQRD